MNRMSILLISISLLILVVSACKKDKIEPTSYDMEIFEAVNTHRTKMGLIPLKHNDFIWQLAREHSLFMASSGSTANHEGVTERYERIREVLGSGATSENVALGNGSGTELVESWLGSISLKQNIEGNYNLTGVSAIRAEDGTWYYTQIFFNQ